MSSENSNLDKNPSINFSSDETQKSLRIEKMKKLQELGFDPFTPSSQRDFSLSFIKFWFDFVHKFDLDKLYEGDEPDLYNLDYFLQQVLFPRSLLERMEDKLQLRHTVREMGLDPDKDGSDFEDEYEDNILDEARSLLPNLLTLNDDDKMFLLREYLKFSGDEENPGNDDLHITFLPHQKVTLVGRLKSKRVSGKIAFGTIEDEKNPDGFQFIFKQDLLESSQNLKLKNWPEGGSLTFENYKDLIDEGDYIQAYGKLDYSQRGEPSLFVEQFTILTKALRPLPEKLEDKELKFRQRYLDMRVNPEVRDLLTAKSRFWTATKDFMDDHGFTQVFMPVMQETTGGAEANPFVTHHDALDEDFYLGISPELHLKRMIVGGFEKVYDIGKNFRNEGIDDEHLQEFLRVEFYWAYATHDDLMDFTENLMKHAIKEAFGTLQLQYKPRDKEGNFTGENIFVDWEKPWPKMPYYDFIQHFSGIDLRQYKTVDELKKLATELGIKVDETDTFGRLTDMIYKKVARPKCIQPVWMTDVPTRLSPLAKRDPKNPETTLRSHLLAYGSELTNGFAELNDPIDQLERFTEQQMARDNGDEEAMMTDMDFVNALEIGLPPTVGFAYSDRLFDLLANKTMREATAFPLLKKLGNNKNLAKGKETRVLHTVILDTPEIPNWVKMNTVAHLSASFAARNGSNLIDIDSSLSNDSVKIPMNISDAIIIKKSTSSNQLLELKNLAENEGLTVVCFTKDMQESSNDKIVSKNHLEKKAADILWLGIAVYGERKLVEQMTQGFELME